MNISDNASNPPKPDEFNESAPVQPGTEVEPNAPAETPAAPNTDPGEGQPTDSDDNSEQEDESAQAQTVADDAMRGTADASVQNEDSEHGGTTNPAQITPDDGQDVVDHMEHMERSGQIDMDAYRGERSDDDEAEMLGEEGMEPGDLDEHGHARRGEKQNMSVE
ncbi:MAG: hypothetical protein ABI668_14190 [Sphingorhabdus sp.]